MANQGGLSSVWLGARRGVRTGIGEIRRAVAEQHAAALVRCVPRQSAVGSRFLNTEIAAQLAQRDESPSMAGLEETSIEECAQRR